MSMSKLSATSRQTIGRWKKWTLSRAWVSRAASYRSRAVESRYSRLSTSTTCTAAPAVPKWTLVPDRCRSYFGSRAHSVMSRAACVSMSSTSARGKRSRPSSPRTAPAPVMISMPDCGASASPICSSASSAASCIRHMPVSLSGRYWPPCRPGRTGRISSANGEARRILRAARPPERRDARPSTAGTMFSSTVGLSSCCRPGFCYIFTLSAFGS